MPKLLYLSRGDVVGLGIEMGEVIEAVETVLLERGLEAVEMPPKPGLHPRQDAFIHAMPAYVPRLEALGIKWVSGYPSNRERGLPYIGGLLILNDPETGLPVCVMDATWITEVRTGSATAVAAKYLARPESLSVGIIACGAQGRSNLEALAWLFPLERALAFDLERRAADRFAREMRERLKLEVRVVESPREAMSGADIVVTSGPILKHPEPSIQPGWLARGAFACALDFDSYWTPAAMAEVDRLITDDSPQLDYYREQGFFASTPRPDSDLGRILAGTSRGRESTDERILCLNLGLAIEDVATAALVYERALRCGAGVQVPL